MTAQKQQTPTQKAEEAQIMQEVNYFFDSMPPHSCIGALSELIETYCVYGEGATQGGPIHFAAGIIGLIARIDRQRDLAGLTPIE